MTPAALRRNKEMHIPPFRGSFLKQRIFQGALPFFREVLYGHHKPFAGSY